MILDVLQWSRGAGNVPGSAEEEDVFDVLIVVGGAGVAIDAVSRGLRVVLVKRNDFSSGTSHTTFFFTCQHIRLGRW